MANIKNQTEKKVGVGLEPEKPVGPAPERVVPVEKKFEVEKPPAPVEAEKVRCCLRWAG